MDKSWNDLMNGKYKFNPIEVNKLARKYLVNLASSCSSERLFSVAGTYFEKRRTRMLGSTLESECLLKSFIDNNGINQLI